MTAFVPCPVCRGPVHPIAGRCKHCKTDLNKVREHQAQAMRAAERAPAAQPAPAGYAPGYGTAMPSPWSRRWPLLVGGIAVVVIAVSLIILFRGKSDASTTSAPGTSRSPRPVPDDMNQQGPLGQNLPMPPKIDPDDPTPTSPFPTPPRHGQRRAPTDATSFVAAFMETVCNKVADCGVQDPGVQMICGQMKSLPGALGGMGGGQQCTVNQVAVDACFEAVERISCDTLRSGDLVQLLTDSNRISECNSALSCI